MKSRRLSIFAGMVCTVCVVLAAAASGQGVRPTPTFVRYSQVADRAFQFSDGIPAEFKSIQYRVVVRFLPSFGATESQVVFLAGGTGGIRVVQYSLKPGSPSIAARYEDALHRNPSSSVEDILTGVTVEKTEQMAEASTVQLLTDLWRLSIPTRLSPNACTDGTIYELWVQTSSNQIHTSFSDCAYGTETDATPVIQWIRAIQTALKSNKVGH